jgi:Protein of unknown function (DUF3800)
MDYLLFIDECGDPSLKNINSIFPNFVLLGLLIEKKEYDKVVERINSLKLEIFGSTEVIFHSRDIRKCEGPFAKLFDLQLKEVFYKKLNSILEEAVFDVIAVAIKKEEFIKMYGKLSDDPYSLSLSSLLEKAVNLVDNNGGRISVKIESRGRKEDDILQKRYNRFLDIGSNNVSSEALKQILIEMAFRKKIQNDCGLQLADLCAYPVARHILNPSEPYPAFVIVKKKIKSLKIFP